MLLSHHCHNKISTSGQANRQMCRGVCMQNVAQGMVLMCLRRKDKKLIFVVLASHFMHLLCHALACKTPGCL